MSQTRKVTGDPDPPGVQGADKDANSPDVQAYEEQPPAGDPDPPGSTPQNVGDPDPPGSTGM